MNTDAASAPASIIERIRKLLALAGNNPNAEEAATAAAMAQDLMAKHHLAEVQLRVETNEPAEPIDHSRVDIGDAKLPGWKSRLISAMRFLGVNPWTEPARQAGVKTHFVRLFGRKSDVEAANYILQYLMAEVERLSQREARSDRAYRNAFRLGAATTVYMRLQAAKKGEEKPTDERALAIVTKDDEELQAAYKVMAKANHLRVQSSPTCRSGDGYAAGKKAGESISIPGQERRKGLGKAPMQLGAVR